MKRRGLLALILTAALVAGGAAPLGAQTKSQKKQRQSQIKEQIQSLRSQIAEASAEEAALLDKVDEITARRRVLDAKVAALDAQVAKAQALVDAATRKLTDLTAQLVAAQAKVTAARQQLAGARRQLQKRAVDAYVGKDQTQLTDLALRIRTFREAAAAQGYLEAVVKAQADVVDRYRALRSDLEGLQAQVSAKRDAARAQRAVVAKDAAVVVNARAAQDAVRDEVLAQERAEAELLDNVRDRKAEFEAQVAALQAESNSIAALLRGRQAGQGLAPSGKGILGIPIPGARITSGYGYRIHPIYKTSRLHAGLDFGASSGTPIRAAADGVVVSAGTRGGYGNCTIIDHGNSLATLYAHQSALLVSSGQRVTKGQVIGRVGSTGMSTGPHLHLEVRVNGTPTDPLRYL